MCRKAKRSGKQCPTHKFELRPVHYSAFMTSDIHATFCPKTVRGRSGTPHFNKDRNYFTPGFVLPSTKKQTQTQNIYYRINHDRCLAQHLSQKQQLWVAKPRSRNNYCAACNDNYQDYLQHVHSYIHIISIRTNPYSKLIAALCQPPNSDVQMQPHITFPDVPSTPLRLYHNDCKPSWQTIQSTRSLPPLDIFDQHLQPVEGVLANVGLCSPRKKCPIVVCRETKNFPSIFSPLQEECK